MMTELYERLCLGTVQLGLNYGIRSRRKDKPDSSESTQLLHTAYRMGIRCFDTADAYGDAEELLCSSGISAFDDVHIITKVVSKTNNGIDSLRDKVEGSLRKLGVSKVDCLLLHEPSDYYDESILRELIEIKETGMVSKIGVSVYEPKDAVKASEDNIIDCIQIPYNILDQRLDETEFFELTKKNKITVFVRSVFLQGLLLYGSNELPVKFTGIQSYIIKFNDIISQYGFSPKEAAFLFSYTHPNIDYVVFGVDNEQQLVENASILKRVREFEECRKKLIGISKEIEGKFLNPSKWEEL